MMMSLITLLTTSYFYKYLKRVLKGENSGLQSIASIFHRNSEPEKNSESEAKKKTSEESRTSSAAPKRTELNDKSGLVNNAYEEVEALVKLKELESRKRSV